MIAFGVIMVLAIIATVVMWHAVMMLLKGFIAFMLLSGTFYGMAILDPMVTIACGIMASMIIDFIFGMERSW